jgi:hypothetical protein
MTHINATKRRVIREKNKTIKANNAYRRNPELLRFGTCTKLPNNLG